MDQTIFEICCGSAEDAIAAWNGGAKRIELNSDLFHGGLTPSIGTLIIVKNTVPDLKVMTMIRPREGGFCYTETEYSVMKADAKALLDAGADGIVFGFLNPDGTVNQERCAEMMAIIGNRVSVFHRAIDVTPDWQKAMDILIELGVHRILTSGQKPTVVEGLETIKQMIAYADNRIEVLPGGGISQDNAAYVKNHLGNGMLHAAIHRIALDESCNGNPAIYFGGAVYPREDRFLLTHSDDVQGLLRAVQ